MLKDLPLGHILFLDIETIPQFADYDSVPDPFRHLWDKKSSTFRDQQPSSEVYPRAGIYAEFGKIICISAGMFYHKDGQLRFMIKSFSGVDEKDLLSRFIASVRKQSAKSDLLLCAHNGKEFDFPYIARRILINRLTLPGILDIAGKKPWDIKHLDTLELWKFGDYKSYTSLDLLMAAFGLESPKDDIDGSQVARVYYEENDLNRIVRYCEKDVVAIARLFQCYRGEEPVHSDMIDIITE
jgi:3'-5' exonuclease